MRHSALTSRFVVCLFVILILFFSKVQADPDHKNPACIKEKFCIESLYIGDFISHFQTASGEGVVLPELVIGGTAQLGSPRWHLEMRHYRGTSQTLPDGFQASVGDFEGRIERRLDDPYAPKDNDSVSRNVLGWLSWKIWTSTDFFSSTIIQERDEGLGFGVTRYPSKEGLSYWYEASIYPSVRTNLADQKNAYTASVGGVYNIIDSLAVSLGYRIQTLRTGTRKTDRAQEQGIVFGLRGSF